MAALQQRCDGSLDVGVGMLPGGLPLVHSHADLLPQHGRAIFGQALAQLGQPAHEADDCSPHSEGMHAKVQAAGLATAVHCQAEVALPACCLEHLQIWATVKLEILRKRN